MAYTMEYQATEFGDGQHTASYSVAVEDTIDLFVNGVRLASILATPEMLDELALGYLICEGIIKSRKEINDILIDGKIISVEIEPSEHIELWRELRSSGCVGVRWDENESVCLDSDAVFNRNFFYKTPNELVSMLPQAAKLADCLRLIVVESFRPGYHIELVMDDDRGQAVAYLKSN